MKRAAVLALLALAGGGGCAGKWESVVERSVAVLRDATDDLPQRALAGSRCVVVFGGTSGIFFIQTAYGTMTCRAGDGAAWGAPGIVVLRRLRMSVPVPGTGPRLILLVMTAEAAVALSEGRTLRVGRDVTARAGSETVAPGPDILVWARSYGRIVGVRMEGSFGLDGRRSRELHGRDWRSEMVISAPEEPLNRTATAFLQVVTRAVRGPQAPEDEQIPDGPRQELR